jgi:hypothetical protein
VSQTPTPFPQGGQPQQPPYGYPAPSQQYSAPPGYAAPLPGYPAPARYTPPRRKSSTGLVLGIVALVLILVCGGGGGAIWYFNSYRPAQRLAAAKDEVRDIGAPTGFGQSEPLYISAFGNKVSAVQATYQMHCPKGVCPTSAAAAVVTWATRAGSTEITDKYLNTLCTSSCHVRLERDGFGVLLYMSRSQDFEAPITTPASLVYEVSARVEL